MGGASSTQPLCPHETEYLSSVLDIPAADVQRLYDEFMKHSKDGYMSKKQFRKFYNSCGFHHLPPRRLKRFTDKLYKYYDLDRNDRLSFNEFISALVMLHGKGTLREKLMFILERTSHDGVLPATIKVDQVVHLCRAFDDIYKVHSAEKVLHSLKMKYGKNVVEVPIEAVLQILEKDENYAPMNQRAFEVSSSENETD